MGILNSARILAANFRRLVAMAPKLAAMPILALLFAGAAPTQAWSACPNSLDFTGAAVGDTRTLDVRDCGSNILVGLYSETGINTFYFFPMIGQTLSVIYNFTDENQTKFEITPMLPDAQWNTPLYTFKLIQIGSSNTGTVPLYYASTGQLTNTLYPISFTVSAAAPTLATVNRNETIALGECTIYFASGSGNNKAVSLFNGAFHFYPGSSYFNSAGTIVTGQLPLSANNVKYCIDPTNGVADVSDFAADGASGTVETDTDIGFSFKLNTAKNGFVAGTYVYSLVNGYSFTPKPNNAPVAIAGDDQEVASGATVTLSGSGTDADDDGLTYAWTQTDGTEVELSDETAQNPTFTAPTVTADTNLTFSLVVNDGTDDSAADTVTITIKAPVGPQGVAQSVFEHHSIRACSVTRRADEFAGKWRAYVFFDDHSGSERYAGGSLFYANQSSSGEPAISEAALAACLGVPESAIVDLVQDGAEGTPQTDTDIGFEFTLTQAVPADPDQDISAVPAGKYSYYLVKGYSFTPAAPTNNAPIAIAGDDQEVASGATVTLSGSGTDDDDDGLTYAWSQTGGTEVEVSDVTAPNPTFTAPTVTTDTNLIFSLIVNDGTVDSPADTVTITVKAPPRVTFIGDNPLIVQSGTSFTVYGKLVENYAGLTWTAEGLVKLGGIRGTGSTHDFDYDFQAPVLPSGSPDQEFEINLVVTYDNSENPDDTATLRVIVQGTPNSAPVANAGDDVAFRAGTMVDLNGLLSTDDDDDELTYAWTQTSGTEVELSDETAQNPTFEAPAMNIGDADLVLTFSLIVNDGTVDSAADTVTITIKAPLTTVAFTGDNPRIVKPGENFILNGVLSEGNANLDWDFGGLGSDSYHTSTGSSQYFWASLWGLVLEENETEHEYTITVTATFGGEKPSAKATIKVIVRAPVNQNQTITFTSDAPTDAVYGGTYTPTATSTSGGAVTFSTRSSIPLPQISAPVSSPVCAIENGIVNFTGVGTCVIYANQSGSEGWNAAEETSQRFEVGKAQNSVGFTGQVPARVVVGDSFTPTASAQFAGEISIFVNKGSEKDVCRFDAAVLHFDNRGTCHITAQVNGTANYYGAYSDPISITVSAEAPKQNQTISFTSDAPTGAVYGGTYMPTAAATSELPVTFSILSVAIGANAIDSSGVCQIANGLVRFTGVGECQVVASQAGDEEWNAAERISQTFEVGKAENSIAFDQATPTTGVVGGSFTPVFTAAHGGDTNFRVHDDGEAGVCQQDGDAVEFLKVGRCSIQAHVVESEHYNRASTQLHSITVTEATQDQTITFTSDAPTDAVYGGTYTPTATATSELPVTFSIGSGLANAGGQSAVCQISGGVVSFTGVGDCVVIASQAGDEEWNAAESVSQIFGVGNAVNSVAFTNQPPRRAVTGASYTPVATALSGRTPVISVDEISAEVCSIAGGLVSFDAKGTCKLIASDAGGEGFEAAENATLSFPIVDPLDISPASGNLGEIPFGVAFELQFEATGGFGGHTFTLADGSILPPGLTLSSDGLLSGTPTEEGAVFAFSIIGTEGSISARLAGGDNSESNASVTGNYTISVGSNPDSDEIEQIGESSTESSAIVSGEVIVDVVSDAASEGFNDTPDLVTQYANGARITLGKQARPGSGLAAIDSVTMEDRKAMRARSGGSIPGLFAYADDGAAASDAVDPQRFQAWASIRFTHVSTSAALNNLEGQQINGLLGLNYRLNEQTVIGAFGGYETMDFADAGSAEFGGSGLTGGIYAAWRPDMGLRYEGQISTTQLGYDVNSGGITGSFDANRIIASLGVSGSTKLGAIYLEPSLKATSVWETQDGYTDSVGTVHDARSFNFGKIAAGLKASTWIDLGEGKSISPYAGVSADWRYSGGDTTKTLEAMDDLSMSLNAGFNAKLNANTSLGLDGTVSGLGLDDIMVWSVRARLGVGF